MESRGVRDMSRFSLSKFELLRNQLLGIAKTLKASTVNHLLFCKHKTGRGQKGEKLFF